MDDNRYLKSCKQIYIKIKQIYKVQLEYINKHKLNKNLPKDILHHYIYVAQKEFWEKVDFFVSVGVNKYRPHNGLIIRSILEQFLQFCYFTSLTVKDKNILVVKEAIRIYKKFYDRDINNSRSSRYWNDQYKKYIFELSKKDENIKNYNFPRDLSEITKSHTEPFPKVEKMCLIVKKILPQADSDKWHDDYKYFCEFTHNGLVVNWSIDEKKSYRQNFMYCIVYSRYMIEVTDRYYLLEKTKEMVLDLINNDFKRMSINAVSELKDTLIN